MTSSRMRKVNELLREVIAEELTNLTDPRIGFVTITGVDTSPDLRNAKVFYTFMAGPEDDEDEVGKSTQDGLDAAARRLQAAIGSQVRLKYTPKLKFIPDSGVAHGLRINKILRELQEEDQ